MMKQAIKQPDTFLYFAYGCNMFAVVTHMHNPTAEFISIARLDDYRLEFNRYSKFWGGPTVTLVPTANAHVWGCLWRLHNNDMISLDDQKGVDVKKYYVQYVSVLTPYMGMFKCRTYIQKVNPLPRGDNDEVPIERWPSWTLKEIMIYGAKEHGLPEYYIESLKALQHNGEEGCLRTACLLTRYGSNDPCQCRVPGRIPRAPLKLTLKEPTLKVKKIAKNIKSVNVKAN